MYDIVCCSTKLIFVFELKKFVQYKPPVSYVCGDLQLTTVSVLERHVGYVIVISWLRRS